jgi:hypothetical protein
MRARGFIYSCPNCGTRLYSMTVWQRVVPPVVLVAFVGFGLLLIVAEMWGIFWLITRMVMWHPEG